MMKRTSKTMSETTPGNDKKDKQQHFLAINSKTGRSYIYRKLVLDFFRENLSAIPIIAMLRTSR